jgi:hypothetical protein
MPKKFTHLFISLLAVLALLAPVGQPASASPATDTNAVSLAQDGLALPAPVELRYDPQGQPFSVPPPPEFFQPHPQSATFAVDYVPAGGTLFNTTCQTFPADAQTAFNAASAIWASLLTSPVTIRIQACWAPLPTGVLGSTGSLNYFRETGGTAWAPQTGTYYPVALANALRGIDSDPAQDDMGIMYSSNYASNFYYGTGPVPANMLDFTSIVLHEIAHGLGFAGSMQKCSSYSLWGMTVNCNSTPGTSTYPASYDQFAADGSGHRLIDPAYYPNYSAALTAVLTGGGVYFNGANAAAGNGGAPAKLYAPAGWAQGSSYSHLDYTTFRNTPNALMVYAIGNGQSIHDPGPVGLGVLKDVGWAPFAPSGLSATGAASQINLQWTDNSRNESGFKVERSPDGVNGWQQIAAPGPNAVTYSNTGLGAGAHFYYRVRAYNALGDSLYTVPADAVTTSVLSAPGGLSASPASPTQVNLAWTDTNSAETGYRIERSDGSPSNYLPLTSLPANSQAYADSSVSPGNAYYYRVQAFNGGASSDWSLASAITWLNPPMALGTATSPTPTQIQLQWQDTNNNESGYKVEHSPTGSAPWTADCTTPVNVTTCTVSGLTEGTQYTLQVWAFNAVSISETQTLNQATALNAPTGLGAALTPANQVSLTWTNTSAAAKNIEVQRSPNGSSGWTTIAIPDVSGTTQIYTDGPAGLAENTPYFYRVRAVNPAIGSSSLYSANATVSTQLAAPTGLLAAPILPTRIDLFWTNNSLQATGVVVERSLDGLSGWSVIASLPASASSYTDTDGGAGLAPNTRYYYRLRAVGASLNSLYTLPVQAITGVDQLYLPLVLK